ncbi:recombinase family protein, partial [Glycomyces sp. NPDC048151]|uniref:recombinase family protein n=1 Tax=Glycomyces sp. NPDC048151 TaxID=3364002 RepID=UPI00371C15DC
DPHPSRQVTHPDVRMDVMPSSTTQASPASTRLADHAALIGGFDSLEILPDLGGLSVEETKDITAIYARRSPTRKDRDEVSIDNQLTNGLEWCVQHGRTRVVLYIDQDRSASNPAKPREAFQRLMADIKDGKLKEVVCRSDERFLRSPIERELSINLLVGAEMPVCYTHDAYNDLTTSGGRMQARIKAAVNRQEVERLAERRNLSELERVKRGMAATTPAPFGLAHTKDRSSYVHVDEEVKVIKEAVDYLIDIEGSTLSEVARRWNAAGITNRQGRPWRWRAVKDALLNPLLTARRAYQRHTYLYESKTKPVESWRAETTPGNWEPVIDADRYETLKLMLTATRQVVGNAARYLGAGTYECGVGEEHKPVRSRWTRNRSSGVKLRYYACHSDRCGQTHLHVKAEEVDEYVVSALKVYLRDPDRFDAFMMEQSGQTAKAVAEPEYVAAAKARQVLEGRRAELATAFATGKISMSMMVDAEARITKELAALEVAELPVSQVERDEVPWSVIEEQWDDLEILAKKKALKRVFPTIRVFPALAQSQGRGKFYTPPVEHWVHIYDFAGRLLPILDGDEDLNAVRLAQITHAAKCGVEIPGAVEMLANLQADQGDAEEAAVS